MRVTTTDGIDLHVSEHGAGPPVVLLSGGPGCIHYLDAERTVPQGFRTFCPDPRGVGRSSGGPHGVATAIADLEQIRRALGVPQWRVAGHSWGADLAVAYALEHPDSVSKVVAVGGTGIQNDRLWSEAYHRLKHTEVLPEISFDAEVHGALIGDWRRNWITRPDLLARLARLPVPVTFVVAAQDIRPPWPLEQLAELVPDGRMHRVPSVAHNFWHTHPEIWRDVLHSCLT